METGLSLVRKSPLVWVRGTRPALAQGGLARGTTWAALILLLFGLGGCQPTGPDGGDDCTPGQPCGGGIDDPDDNDNANGNGNDNDPDDPQVGNSDHCSEAGQVSGVMTQPFDNSTATTDGLAHAACTVSGQDQIELDFWLCWTAECTTLAVVETCGETELDTRIAVYRGCDCPASHERLLNCSDDDCGVQSRATFAAQAGEQYLIRVGNYPGTDGGTGAVSITCGFDGCPGSGGCTTAHGGRGCDDEACCNEVCEVDPVCCSGGWDDICATEAAAFCNGGFDSCESGAGPCTQARTTPGCDNAECCDAVCRVDTYCCMEEWDAECVALESRICFGACEASADSCLQAHEGPGCNDAACCAEVCPREASCCQTSWSETCAELAGEHCAP